MSVATICDGCGRLMTQGYRDYHRVVLDEYSYDFCAGCFAQIKGSVNALQVRLEYATKQDAVGGP